MYLISKTRQVPAKVVLCVCVCNDCIYASSFFHTTVVCKIGKKVFNQILTFRSAYYKFYFQYLIIDLKYLK